MCVQQGVTISVAESNSILKAQHSITRQITKNLIGWTYASMTPSSLSSMWFWRQNMAFHLYQNTGCKMLVTVTIEINSIANIIQKKWNSLPFPAWRWAITQAVRLSVMRWVKLYTSGYSWPHYTINTSSNMGAYNCSKQGCLMVYQMPPD